jgi:hypothetical protein
LFCSDLSIVDISGSRPVDIVQRAFCSVRIRDDVLVKYVYKRLRFEALFCESSDYILL